MVDGIRPKGTSEGHHATPPAVPQLNEKVFGGGAMVSPVTLSVSGETNFKTTFSRQPGEIGQASACDGVVRSGGIFQLGLGTTTPASAGPDPLSEFGQQLRGKAFDATIADCYGLRPLDEKNSPKLALLLRDPAIAGQRQAFLFATFGKSCTLVLPQRPQPAPA